MNRLTTEQRAQILGLMVEGMAIRAISRTTGASKNTIVKLLRDASKAGYLTRYGRTPTIRSVAASDLAQARRKHARKSSRSKRK